MAIQSFKQWKSGGEEEKKVVPTTKLSTGIQSFSAWKNDGNKPVIDSSVQDAVDSIEAPKKKMPQLFGKDLLLTPENGSTLGILKTSSKYLSSFGAGALDIASSIGQTLTRPVEKLTNKITGVDADVTEDDPLDQLTTKMRDYAGESFANDVFSALGSSAPFLFLGGAAGAASAGLSGTTKATIGAVQSVPESFVEAKQTYETIKEEGGSPKKAITNALGTFISNEILNTGTFLVGFGANATTKTKDFLKEYFSEIGQENLQQVFQNVFTNKPILSGLAETTAISAIISAPAGIVNITSKDYKKKPSENPSAFLKDLADKGATAEQVADFITKTTGTPIDQVKTTLDQSIVADPELAEQYQKNFDESLTNEIDTLAKDFMVEEDIEGVQPFLQQEKPVDEVMFKKEVATKENDLVAEARKYKSADEFVKAQGTPVYHGSNEKIKVFSNKKGSQGVIWFTDNPKAITTGESGAQGNKIINERITTGKKFAGWDEYEKLGLGQIKDMGFDGIKLPTKMQDGTIYNDYVFFDNKTLKTKSQLTEIYNKATKEEPKKEKEPVLAFKKMPEGQSVQSKQFKEWFGDWEKSPVSSSKIVDDAGKPMVVFHGTANEFDTFDKNRIGARDSGWFGKGFYFTQSKGEASYYGKNVISAYLNIRNPFDFSKYGIKEHRGYSYADTHTLAMMSEDVPGLNSSIKGTIYKKGNESTDFKRIPEEVTLGSYKKMVQGENLTPKPVEFEDRGKKTISYRYIDIFGSERWYDTKKEKPIPNELLKYVLFDEKYQTNFDVGGLYAVERKIANSYGDKFTEELKNLGYDGTMQSPDGDEYVVFDDDQIMVIGAKNDNVELKKTGITPQAEKPTQDLISSVEKALGVKVITDPTAFEQRLGDFAKMVDTSGTIYGFTEGKNIYINQEYFEKGVLFHEAGHLWMRVLEKKNRALFNRAKTVLKDSKYYQQVLDERPDVTNENARLEEAFAIAMEDYRTKPKTVTEKVKKVIDDIINAIMGLFGNAKGSFDVQDVMNMSIDDIINMAGSQLEAGKPLRELPIYESEAFKKVKYEEFGNLGDELVADAEIPVIRDMPESLADQKMELQLMNEYLKSSVGNELEKYINKKEGELPEAGVMLEEDVPKSIRSKNVRKFLVQGEQILEDLGFTGPTKADDAMAYLREFQESKKAYKEALAEYRKDLKEYTLEQKDARAVEKILNKVHKDFIKMVKQREKLDALHARIFKKGFKQGLTEAKRGFVKMTTEQKRVQSFAQSMALMELRKEIPAKDRWKYIKKISDIKDVSDYLKVHDLIEKEAIQNAIIKQENLQEAKIRQSIGYLKKIFDIEPSLILSIKDKLDIKTGDKRKSIKDYTFEELLRFREELNTRIQYRKDNPVSYLSMASLKDDKKSIFKKIGEKAKMFDDTVVAPVERKVKRISNVVFESLMTYYFENNTMISKFTDKVKPLYDVFGEATEVDQELISKYAQDGNEPALREILERYSSKEDVDQMLSQAREVLDEMYEAFNSVGIKVPYRKSYFPRKLKPLDSKKAELAIKMFEYKFGQKATAEERAVLFEKLLRGFNPIQTPFITLSGKRFEAQRLLETIPDEFRPFYEDFATAFTDYIEAGTAVINQRKFFGKSIVESLDYEATVSSSITKKVLDLYESGQIQQKDVDELKEVLHLLFQYRLEPWKQKVQQFTADYIYPFTLGQMTNAINQTKDLSMQVLMNDIFAGQVNTIGGIPITPEMVGLSDSLQKLETGIEQNKNVINTIGNAIMTPFSKTDQFYLRVFINSAYRRLIKDSRANDPALKKQLGEIFGADRANEMMQELANQDMQNPEVTPEIARWIFGEVSKTRPITKLQKAEFALKNPAFYTLKNFMIKQLQFVRSQSLDVIADGVREKDAKKIGTGIAKLVTLAAVIGALGAGVDDVVDWILGRNKDDSFFDKVQNNLLAIVGYNNYLIGMAQRSGIAESLVMAYLSPATITIPRDIVSDAIKDVKDSTDENGSFDPKSIKRLPWFGNVAYYRIGGGKQEEKVNWKDSTSKELKQFREEVGDERFEEANKKYNVRYNIWLKNTSDKPAFKALSEEQQKKVISNKKSELKKDILDSYGFEYEKQKSEPLPEF